MPTSGKPVDATPTAHYRRGRHERTWQDEGKRLQLAIEINQWFLDPRFSLSQLSERAGLNNSYASHSLNFGLGKSFKMILNEHRLSFAKKLIEQDKHSLLTIALNSGFGSKATFNRVFLSLTSETPSQYRFRKRRENAGLPLVTDPSSGGNHAA